MISAVLGIILFIVVIFLILIVVDAYFTPFMSAQIYGGKCDNTDDDSCRKGLACRPDSKDVTKYTCQEDISKCPASGRLIESEWISMFPGKVATADNCRATAGLCPSATSPSDTECARLHPSKVANADNCRAGTGFCPDATATAHTKPTCIAFLKTLPLAQALTQEDLLPTDFPQLKFANTPNCTATGTNYCPLAANPANCRVPTNYCNTTTTTGAT